MASCADIDRLDALHRKAMTRYKEQKVYEATRLCGGNMHEWKLNPHLGDPDFGLDAIAEEAHAVVASGGFSATYDEVLASTATRGFRRQASKDRLSKGDSRASDVSQGTGSKASTASTGDSQAVDTREGRAREAAAKANTTKKEAAMERNMKSELSAVGAMKKRACTQSEHDAKKVNVGAMKKPARTQSEPDDETRPPYVRLTHKSHCRKVAGRAGEFGPWSYGETGSTDGHDLIDLQIKHMSPLELQREDQIDCREAIDLMAHSTCEELKDELRRYLWPLGGSKAALVNRVVCLRRHLRANICGAGGDVD